LTTQADLIGLINRLRSEPYEQEYFEFKANNYEPQLIGEYLSALSNGACLAGKPRGYLIFGIDDTTHTIIGTNFDPYSTKGKGNQDLLLWLSLGLHPNVGFEATVVDHPEGRLILFAVTAAWDRPVKFYGTAYIRIGSSKTELSKHPELERAIWTIRTDWSSQICESASLEDIDPVALIRAREEFITKHPGQAVEAGAWDDITFLNKAGLTIRGAMTYTALLLLGRPESTALLSPAVARITWILKDDKNQELDYYHADPPFLIRVDEIFKKIRNLTIRVMPTGTLFPKELSQYDSWVIREALHNCIAHQDYTLRGRIQVIETPDAVLLTNLGRFLPGDVETVILQDAPLEIYRSPFLTAAMVNLNMIDTQGGGIKKMYQAQARRFFPLPDYDISEPDRVKVTIPGRILDEQYTRLLMERTDLDLHTIILLDTVQKHKPLSKEEHAHLKKEGLVEGRYPKVFIAGSVAEVTGQTAKHMREKGFDDRYYQDLILLFIREHGPVSRKEIDDLLMGKLPEILTEGQKSTKIHNLVSTLSRQNQIKNTGTRKSPNWIVLESEG
jgi:ATP-dependent DNA helicase RecG